MGFLRRSSNQLKPDYTGLDIQTSVSTLPIPIVWGQGKIGGNVIWYTDFLATPLHSSSSGGKGGSEISGYNYNVNVAIALCEGPIESLVKIYKDQSLYLYQWLGFAFYNGSTPQGVWSGFEAVSTSQLLAYQGTAFVSALYYNLGDSGSLGNHNFEIAGILAGTGVNGIDADPAQVIYDFLTNAQYGVAGLNGSTFPASMIDGSTLFGSGGDSSLQTYCKAMGIAFSPILSSQEQASSILTRWLQICNCAAVWSGGMLSFVPYGDTSIGAGSSSTITAQFTIPTPIPPNSTTEPQIPASVAVCSSAQFVSDGGVKYASSGVSFAFLAGDTDPTTAGTYGMSPNGTYIFAPPDEGVAVIITYTVQAVTSFVPNITPVYGLGDNNLVDEKGNKDPLQVERVDVFSLPTIQRIEVCDRSNWYASVPVEARDQAQIEIFGPRVGPVVQAHEICDPYTIGPLVAQTILQRELYVRAKFTFKLSWEYCLLDPMDVVTITDSNLGLNNYPVRIISIEEDDKGLLSITAEELVTGVSSPAYNPSAAAGSALPQLGAPAHSVNTPLIFEPPTAATGGVAQLWVGASGQYGQTLQWGGAYVWLSIDGVNFSQIATIETPLRQGFLTAPLPNASGWDTADTLAVSLVESGGALTGTSQAAAQAGGTLSLVDNELVAYETVTLTGTNAYSLTGLQRGMGGSTSAAHGTGAPFARLDSAVVQYDLQTNLIGQTLYLKFQSYNAFGAGAQSLSECAVYAFAATGSGVADPIAAQLLNGVALDLGQVSAAVTLSDDFGSPGGGVASLIDLGAITLSDPIATQLLSGSRVDLGQVTNGVTVSDDFGQVTIAATATINLGTAP